jgi:hypothetical protein
MHGGLSTVGVSAAFDAEGLGRGCTMWSRFGSMHAASNLASDLIDMVPWYAADAASAELVLAPFIAEAQRLSNTSQDKSLRCSHFRVHRRNDCSVPHDDEQFSDWLL